MLFGLMIPQPLFVAHNRNAIVMMRGESLLFEKKKIEHSINYCMCVSQSDLCAERSL